MSTITMTLDLPDNITLNIEEPLSPFEVSRKQVENGELYEAKDLDDLFKQLND